MPARPGIAKLLRAPWNFEEDYDAQHGNVPVIFTAPYTKQPLAAGTPDVYTALDQEAQQVTPPVGISPLLARMMPVPMGATVLLMLPVVQTAFSPVLLVPPFAYVWRAVFRMRSVADYQRRKKNRVPWSIPLSRLGTEDTRSTVPPGRPNTPVAGPRVVRQACSEAVIYNRSEPDPTSSPPFFGTIFSDASAIPTTNTNVTKSPFYPGFQGVPSGSWATSLDYEQGERDPGAYGGGLGQDGFDAGPFHLPKFLKCVGNEMCVECFKYNLDTSTGRITGPRDWQFKVDDDFNVTAEDYYFSLLLGVGARVVNKAIPADTGVRVITGEFSA